MTANRLLQLESEGQLPPQGLNDMMGMMGRGGEGARGRGGLAKMGIQGHAAPGNGWTGGLGSLCIGRCRLQVWSYLLQSFRTYSPIPMLAFTSEWVRCE